MSTITEQPQQKSPLKQRLSYFIPGLMLVGVITFISISLGHNIIFEKAGLSTLTLAIVIGILFGNTFYRYLSGSCHLGVNFSKQRLLRLGIILYGFRLTFQQITDVGLSAIIIDALTLTTTFLLAYILGTRIFKIDRQTTILIGAGSSICGAAAVMGTAPVTKSDASKVTVAVSTVVIFGTIAMFIYPWFYSILNSISPDFLTEKQFGIYIGSTVHEVAQVVAAGKEVGEQASNTAVITKMIRVMMLAPFLLILSAYLDQSPGTNKNRYSSITIPWFAVLFIAVAGLNSMQIIPEPLVHGLVKIDEIFLTMAMAALGLTTHIDTIKQAGIKPLLLAGMLFLWLIVGGYLINLSLIALIG